MEKIRQNDIYICDFGNNSGSIQNGVRPALVIQTDELNSRSPTTVVAPVTTSIKKETMPSHVLLSRKSGLKKRSMVLLEQAKTVNQSDLKKKIGCVKDESTIRKINQGIRKTLGYRVRVSRSEPVHCLCINCLNRIMSGAKFVVKRLDSFHKIRGECELCRKQQGYYYTLTKRRFLKNKSESNRIQNTEPGTAVENNLFN